MTEDEIQQRELGPCEIAAACFNEGGMTDDLATLLGAFVCTKGDPDATTNLLNYADEYVASYYAGWFTGREDKS